jgi:hypothetical protein
MARRDALLVVLTVVLCSPCCGFLSVPHTQRAALSCSSPHKRTSSITITAVPSQTVALRAKYDDYDLGLDDGAGPQRPRKRATSSQEKQSSRRTIKERGGYSDDDLFGRRYDRDNDRRRPARPTDAQSTGRSDFVKSIAKSIGFAGALSVALGVFNKPAPKDPALDIRQYDGQTWQRFAVEPEEFLRGLFDLKLARVALTEALKLTETDNAKAAFKITTTSVLFPWKWRETCIFWGKVLPATDKVHYAAIQKTTVELNNDMLALFNKAEAKQYDNFAGAIKKVLADMDKVITEAFYAMGDPNAATAAAATAAATTPAVAGTPPAAVAPATVAPAAVAPTAPAQAAPATAAAAS